MDSQKFQYGKPPINGQCSIAMLVYQRVNSHLVSPPIFPYFPFKPMSPPCFHHVSHSNPPFFPVENHQIGTGKEPMRSQSIAALLVTSCLGCAGCANHQRDGRNRRDSKTKKQVKIEKTFIIVIFKWEKHQTKWRFK